MRCYLEAGVLDIDVRDQLPGFNHDQGLNYRLCPVDGKPVRAGYK